MNKKLLLPIIIVVVLGVAAAAYFLIFANKEEKEPVIELIPYDLGDAFVGNVRDGNKYFQVKVQLAIEKALGEELAKEESLAPALIRETIQFLLMDLTEEQFRALDAKEVIGQSIVDALNTRLELEEHVPRVHQCIFTAFVIQ